MFKKIGLLYTLFLRGKKMLRYGGDSHFERIGQHSDRVRKFKKRIFYLIIALLLVLSLLPFLSITGNSKFNFQTEQGSLSGEASLAYDKPVVVNPRYSGLDKNNREFRLNAARGMSEDRVNVQLEDIDGQIILKDGTAVDIKSKRGVYNIENKQLNLSEGVIIDVSSGYHLETKSATVKTDENMATGVDPVNITGKMGDLHAQGGFTIKDSGDQILFHGGVKMMVRPDELEK
jgi:hypothetical protein